MFNHDGEITFNHKGFKFQVYCELYEKEISQGVAQPFDSDMYWLKKFLELNPDRNKIMIDVGAHIGVFSVIYSQFFDSVFAYEPNRKSYEYLLRNIKLNNLKNVDAQMTAVADDMDRGDIVSFGSEQNSATFKLVPGSSVKCIKLDEHFIAADFIKIDTEGYDVNVLKSAERLLTKSMPFLQVEVMDLEGYEFLNSLGYVCVENKHDSFFWEVPRVLRNEFRNTDNE